MTRLPSDARRSAAARLRPIASPLAEGVTLGVMVRWLDIVHVGYVEAALAGGASFVAVKLLSDAIASARATETAATTVPPAAPPPAILPQPRASDLPVTTAARERRANALARERAKDQDDQFPLRDSLDARGPIASREGARWLVYDDAGSDPRVLSDREYARLRRTARDLVEIERTWEGIRVQRLYLGRLDSSLTGKPSVEVHSTDLEDVIRTEWHVEGSPSDEPSAMEAHEALRSGMPASPRP